MLTVGTPPVTPQPPVLIGCRGRRRSPLTPCPFLSQVQTKRQLQGARSTPDLGNEVSSRICWYLQGEELRFDGPIKTSLTFLLAKHILVCMMSPLSTGTGR